MSYYNNANRTYSAQGANSYGSGKTSKSTLECVFCKETKRDAFSGAQIAKASTVVFAKNGKVKKPQLTCKKCTASQQTELTCMICTKTMPLSKFAKAQRKNGERARCMTCLKKKEEEEIEDSEEDDDG
ncbi:Stc1 domain-containing protein [Jimgerdemannia flammicorona]|uniref:Stc1 domain-containing protein n=1 Tax=Jimgerdemannia flammicorona TaxID=994334 RepID=A0A433DLZ5_9FUNG|nr:Stc1 domain-containing protein [Jimgerdemannia flammicorona]